MKKKGLIVAIVAFAVIGGTSAAFASGAVPYIGKDKAAKAALKEVPGTVTELDLEHKNGKAYYEVEVQKKDSREDTDVYIDATSGKVLAVHDDRDDDRKKPSVTAKPEANANASGSAKNTAAGAKVITKERAIELAQQAVKGEVIKVEKERDDGIQKYEVKLRTSEGTAEVELHAATGKVLSIDYDRYDDDDHDDDDDDDFDDDDDYYEDDSRDRK
ncbi:PepSY domain-containing protein [Paenibacillus sp. NPDC057967]|uniref:PepSY domain-containing protein n=1 Tax=Paenibacillus sp. NPDC057967 TaxID=3346293 RepID=UPI0036DDEAEB